MIGKDPETLPTRLFEAYKKQLYVADLWKNKEPGGELIYIDYKDALNHTEEVVKKVKSFIDVPLDTAQMMNCVDKSLYRNKVERTVSKK